MLRRFYISVLPILACILPLLSGCKERSEYAVANSVREDVITQFADDTTQYISALRDSLSAVSLNSQEDCARMYKYINRLTLDMYHAGNDAEAVSMLKHIFNTLHEADNRTKQDTRQLLNLYVRLGATFTDMGMPVVGLDYYINGLGQCSADTSYNDYKAMLYNNIGILYAEHRVYDKAQEYFSRALEINKQLKSQDGVCMNYSNLAELYILQGDISKAQDAVQKCLDYLNQERNAERLAAVRALQGDIYSQLKDYDMARMRYHAALAKSKEINDVSGEINAALRLSDLFLKTNQTDSAMVYASDALRMSEQLGRKDDRVETMLAMSSIYEAKGDCSTALRLSKEANEQADSLRNEESALRLTNWDGMTGNMFMGNDEGMTHSMSDCIWIIAAIVLVAVVIILVISCRASRRRRKLAELMTKKEKELNEARQELAALSDDHKKMQEEIREISEKMRHFMMEMSPEPSAKRDYLRSILNHLTKLTEPRD